MLSVKHSTGDAMKLREGDVFYGTVGVLGLFGVLFVIQTADVFDRRSRR